MLLVVLNEFALKRKVSWEERFSLDADDFGEDTSLHHRGGSVQEELRHVRLHGLWNLSVYVEHVEHSSCSWTFSTMQTHFGINSKKTEVKTKTKRFVTLSRVCRLSLASSGIWIFPQTSPRSPLLSLSEIYISSVHSLLLPHWLLDHQLSFFLFYTHRHTLGQWQCDIDIVQLNTLCEGEWWTLMAVASRYVCLSVCTVCEQQWK